MQKDPIELEKHRLERYHSFAKTYHIQDFELFVELYDIDELSAFMPTVPTEKEMYILNELIGTMGTPGYMDYEKSNNTFELIMQWREQTGNYGDFQVNPDLHNSK
ncbi:MAG: hypothetical protein AAF824_13365 [Bacteroidota bacterium]